MTTTTKDPARGTGDPSADGLPAGGSPAPRGPHTSPGRGAGTVPVERDLLRAAPPAAEGHAIAPAGLTPPQVATLRLALNDAIDHRDPAADCTACEDNEYGLCGDHEDDLALADQYSALAAELGIELEDA